MRCGSGWRQLVRYEARKAVGAALEPLSEWLQDEVLQQWRTRLAQNKDFATEVQDILVDLPSLAPYQTFRTRAVSLSKAAIQVFGTLRERQGALEQVPAMELEAVVRRIIRREALLAAKARLEGCYPELLYERAELETKVGNLARLDAEMRKLNQTFLADHIDHGRLGTAAAWEDLTRLRGPRAKRLREFVDLGADLGLMRLRPVWLMNPDVASRVLPLRNGALRHA